MKRYFLFILNRTLSGIVNGLFYAGSKFLFPVMILFAIFTGWELISNLIFHWHEMQRFDKIMSIIGIVISLLTIVGLGISFKVPKWDIHLWTWLNQTSISGTLFFTGKNRWKNIWWLMLSVSPAAFFQKVMINLLGGYNWDYKGTDVVSGKYWSMKVFGKIVRVPRLANMKVKLVIAFICVVTFLLIHYFHKSEPSTGIA